MPASCPGEFVSNIGNVCLKSYISFGKFNLTKTPEAGLGSWWSYFHRLIVYNGAAASLY